MCWLAADARVRRQLAAPKWTALTDFVLAKDVWENFLAIKVGQTEANISVDCNFHQSWILPIKVTWILPIKVTSDMVRWTGTENEVNKPKLHHLNCRQRWAVPVKSFLRKQTNLSMVHTCYVCGSHWLLTGKCISFSWFVSDVFSCSFYGLRSEISKDLPSMCLSPEKRRNTEVLLFSWEEGEFWQLGVAGVKRDWNTCV